MRTSRPVPITQSILAAFAHSAKMNTRIAKRIPAAFWNARPDNRATRTIAAMFAHMLHVQQITARTLNATSGRTSPAKILPQQHMVRSLTTSANILIAHMTPVLSTPDAYDPATVRRTTHKLLYLLAHDAHHRGQIFLLAHRFGFTVSHRETMRLWRWS